MSTYSAGVMEEQARFLVAKYGTAAGPTGLPLERFVPGQSSAVLDAASLMILLGFLLLVAIVFVIMRDFYASRSARESERRRAAMVRRDAGIV